MNAPLPALPPASQTAAASPSANPQEAAAPEVPFSKVLSGEMAQQRRADANAQDATQPDPGAPVAGSMPGAGASAPEMPADKPASDALRDETDPALLPGLPDAMLALALHPELLKPAAPPTVSGRDVENADTQGYPGIALPAPGAGNPPAVRPEAGDAAARGKRMEAIQPHSDADEVHNAAAARHEKMAVAESAAPRLPDAMRTAERVPDFPAAMAIAQTAQVATAATAGLVANERLAPSVGTSAWNQALGDRIVWMAVGGQQSAALTLNPPDLGPMQVVLNVSNDQATASFFAAQPEVRQALEAALPRLRDMMQDAGIQLGQATVSADTPRQQDMPERAPQRAATPFMAGDNGTAAGQAAVVPQPVRAGRGLVDTFA